MAIEHTVDKYAIGIVAGADEEAFCIVFTGDGLIRKTFFGDEAETRAALKELGNTPMEIEQLIIGGRQHPV
jgi:hypothetical protein